jgi:hypothetical protein
MSKRELPMDTLIDRDPPYEAMPPNAVKTMKAFYLASAVGEALLADGMSPTWIIDEMETMRRNGLIKIVVEGDFASDFSFRIVPTPKADAVARRLGIDTGKP